MKYALRNDVAFRLALISLACVATVALNPTAQSQPSSAAGARAMFYDPVVGNRPPDDGGAKSGLTIVPRPIRQGETPHFIGVHYWIEQIGRGTATVATPFVTGDRIRLHVRSNVDGYLAVWTFDNSGRAELLLPVGGNPDGTAVQAGSDYGSPTITFAPPARNESMMLFLGRDRAQMPKMSTVELGAAASTQAKDLRVEVVNSVDGEVGTYVVNANGGPVAHMIVLQHVAAAK